MAKKSTYEELEQRVKELEKETEKRKQADVALSESEAKSRNLLNLSPDPIAIIQNNRHAFINQRFTELFGYTMQDVDKGLIISQLVLEKDSEIAVRRTKERLLGKKPGSEYIVTNIVAKDGKSIPCEVSGNIIEYEEQSANLVIMRDITDRKQAEEALRESEEKYRNLFNNVPVGLFWSRIKDGKLVECNESFAQLIGYNNREECINEVVGAEHYVDPSVRKQMLAEIKNKGEINNFEANFTRKDGTQFWVSYSMRIYPKKDILEGAAIDITERKAADQALRASEEKYRTLLNNAAVPISFWAFQGTEWHIVLLNAVAARGLGGTQEELVGKTLDEIFPDFAGLDIFRKRFNSISESGMGDQFEEEIELKTGETHWFRSDIQPVKDPGDSVIAIQVLSEDITERKRAEEELHHLRNYLSNIIDSMPSILIGVDKEGNVTQWNVEAQRATGLLPEEAVGQPLEQAFPRLASEIARVRRAMQSRKVLSDAKQARQEGGEMRYEDLTVYPLITNGIEGAVIRIDDVTDKVRIEEMMIQSEKMLSVGGLAAGMAHEINNPLAGIMQNVQVIKNRMSGELSKNIAVAEECGTSIAAIETYMEKRGMFRMIESVMESGKRAAKIVNNMLSFSRKSDESFAPHSLCDLLDKTVELAENDYDLKKTFDFRQIEIVEKYDKTTPQVTCEGSKIQQVILNILKNGAQAMAKANEQKTEEESVSRFTLRVMPDGEMARIEIEDNGPGMDEETRKRVFEPFFTTKGVGIGTGLGLSVSYFIITENHGGAMEVESSPGKGAKFIIRLPFERNVH